MAVQFHPLPDHLFSDEQRPYIQRLNRELRELFALEGVLRQPIQSSRSDATVARRAEVQVDVSRITPDIMPSIMGSSIVTGVPALTFGLVNAAGTTTTAIATDASLAIFGTATPTGVSLTAAVGSSAFAARADHRHDHPVFTGGDLHEDLLPRSGVRDMTGTLGTDVGTFRSDATGVSSGFVLTDSVARAAGEYHLSVVSAAGDAIARVGNITATLPAVIVNRPSSSVGCYIAAEQWAFRTGLDGVGTPEFDVATGVGNRIFFRSQSDTRGFRFVAGSSSGPGIEIFCDNNNVANDHQIILRKQRADSTSPNDFVLIDHTAAFGDSRHIVAVKANGTTLSTVTQGGRWAVTGISFGLYKGSNGRWQQINGLPGGRLKFIDFGTTEPTL